MRPNALLLAALLVVAPVPVRAEPLERPVVGPMLVCFKYSSFSLADGERIIDFEGGAEGMAVRVEGPHGAYWIEESEIFITPRLGRLLSDNGGTRVYRLRGRARQYAIVGATNFSGGEDRAVIRLEGGALTGTARMRKYISASELPIRLLSTAHKLSLTRGKRCWISLNIERPLWVKADVAPLPLWERNAGCDASRHVGVGEGCLSRR